MTNPKANNGAKEMQLEIAETLVGAGYMFPKKASHGMTSPKANNGAKEMQLEVAETSVGAGYMFPK